VNSLLWGLFAMQPIFLPAPVHTLVTAPAGAGKSTCFAIPNAYFWPKSLVTLDIKGEIFTAAARWRARGLRRRQVRLDPLRVLGPGGDTLNVLAHLDPASPSFLAEIRCLAEALIIKEPQEKDPHWNQSSEIWLAGLLADVVRHLPPAHRNLQAVRTVMTNAKFLSEAVSRLVKSEDEFLRRAGGMLLNYSGKELFSTLTNFNRHLSFLDDPLIYEFTVRSSFSPRALLDGNTDVWFLLPPQFLRSQGRLARLVLTSFLRTVAAAGIDRHREILFLLDEFPALGRMDILQDAITQYRGYGVRLCMIIQSLSQIAQMFPEGQHEVVMANTDQIYLGIRDYPTAEAVSKKCGQATVHTRNAQISTGRSWSEGHGYSEGGNAGWSQGVGETGKALLRPEEVLNLGKRRAVVFLQNLSSPLLVDTCPYYQDAAFLGGTSPLGWRHFVHCLSFFLLTIVVAASALAWRADVERQVRPGWQAYPPAPWVIPQVTPHDRNPAPFPVRLPPPASG
jgi:type IV secretion system protein VirD4